MAVKLNEMHKSVVERDQHAFLRNVLIELAEDAANIGRDSVASRPDGPFWSETISLNVADLTLDQLEQLRTQVDEAIAEATAYNASKGRGKRK
jgi:hypothetical protein